MKQVTASVWAMQNRLNRRMLPAPTQLLIHTLTGSPLAGRVSVMPGGNNGGGNTAACVPVMVHSLNTHVAAGTVLGAKRLRMQVQPTLVGSDSHTQRQAHMHCTLRSSQLKHTNDARWSFASPVIPSDSCATKLRLGIKPASSSAGSALDWRSSRWLERLRRVARRSPGN